MKKNCKPLNTTKQT